MKKGIDNVVVKQNLAVFERVFATVKERRASSGIFLPTTIPTIIHECMMSVARDLGIEYDEIEKNMTKALHLSLVELNENLSDYIYDMSPVYEKKLLKYAGKDADAVQKRLHEIKGSTVTSYVY